ncbi:hypothetical protein HYV88_02795 [Candidatus Woesearchaeota archaeon]|nr:hypothetical protein [Candidatus Woesearchaeota archaeon]
MKLDKLVSSTSELTPQQKLEVLGRELKREKTEKGKEQILLLIESAKKEQEDIEERLREVAKKPEQEQPLENIVQEKNPELDEVNNNKEKERVLRIYGVEERKPQELYGMEHTKESQEEKKSEYRLSTEDRFTQQREQNFISNEERLKRERKKYEIGRV